MEEEDQILQHLRKDAENYTDLLSCSHKFMGGVVFRKFDTHPANLDYDILIPTSHIMGSDIWRFNEEWHDPFEISTVDVSQLRLSPYLRTGFLSLQLEIDFLFIRSLKPNATVEFEKFEFSRIPDSVKHVTAASSFLYQFPHLWMLCAFVLVIYTAREISSERSTVKVYLAFPGFSVCYGPFHPSFLHFACTLRLTENHSSLFCVYVSFVFPSGTIPWDAMTS
ncbi:hypothetical protein GCK32_014898 [Trichostrongylus colubriformis]|uniref:Uncharacterized protein n=1 Tax=Trichostrongylus colubriformis TaxID=6319 RepID=A0AAN8IHP9_TRICO